MVCELRVATYDPDFLGFVWSIEANYSDGNITAPSIWNVIASEGRADAAIYPNYTVDVSKIRTIEISAIDRGNPDALRLVRGKTVVIETRGTDRRSINVPDNNFREVSASQIQIIAAQTAISGAGQFVDSWITISALGIVLLFGLLIFRKARKRRIFYAALTVGFATAVVLTAMAGVRVMFAEPLAILIVFAITRGTSNYRQRHLYRDPRSRLPNFGALRRDLESSRDLENVSIVIAKIARLEASLASLSERNQGLFLRQAAARLTLGDADAKIYHDGGKYFCILLCTSDYDDLQSHLEGLRAVASQAIVIADRAIDVSMTIGVDQSGVGVASSRISQAISAADQAREAYRPVFIVTDFEADSETWDYSLQSRLEAALSENRINIKLQPQLDLRTGQFVGAEALARWSDEVRGEISPAHFIPQCERVGRLDQLTKRVLQLGMEASHSFEQNGLPAKVSINVSAIQFVDHRIAELIEGELLVTGANPANIMIEITESARIASFEAARDIMERLIKLGIEFSIDDFGVASANLDTLYQLPFSELKIDRMFADAVTRKSSARAITENLIKLSKDLGLVSVAEGIEDFDTLEMLKAMGADRAQGFVIARPQTFQLLEETLRLQRGTVRRSSG